MDENKITADIINYGRMAEAGGLVHGNLGNVSVRSGESFYITATGTMLGHLTESGIVKLSVNGPDEKDKLASLETPVHREIYRRTDAGAVLHTHARYCVVMSLIQKERGKRTLDPIDLETREAVGDIPIIEVGLGDKRTGEVVAEIMNNGRPGIVIVKGHGVFVAASTLREAYIYTETAEHGAKVKYLYELMMSHE